MDDFWANLKKIKVRKNSCFKTTFGNSWATFLLQHLVTLLCRHSKLAALTFR